MPAFQRLLVLSALALPLSVQAAPTGTIESREFGQATDLEARYRPVGYKGPAGPHHYTPLIPNIGRDVEEEADALEARGEEDSPDLERRGVRARPHKGGNPSHGNLLTHAVHDVESIVEGLFKRDEELERRRVRARPGKPSHGNPITHAVHDVESIVEGLFKRDDYEELERRRTGHQHHSHKGKASKGKHSSSPDAPPPVIVGPEIEIRDFEEDAIEARDYDELESRRVRARPHKGSHGHHSETITNVVNGVESIVNGLGNLKRDEELESRRVRARPHKGSHGHHSGTLTNVVNGVETIVDGLGNLKRGDYALADLD
ncbi:hypothetical protein GSI_04859 [Ganoderma sinense ZZ0214-1]|uniref:Transporter n=1 Tax=Ganoderma sinense ZZ0214-1 TaxID=1077348 RepID=A0A2G8SG48_9APHY|nr:hypothetical protein GSI_04859 [Ganoderma sinense ZZ0214-1]